MSYHPTISNNLHNTQGRTGIARPRLYTLEEIGAEIGMTKHELIGLVKAFKIRSPFEKARPLKYRMADFKVAANIKKGTDFVIEKAVPIPVKHPRTAKWSVVLGGMEVGDSILLSQEDAMAMYNAVRRDHPDKKIVTRREDDKRRVWRVT